jgi:hypothetical protein
MAGGCLLKRDADVRQSDIRLPAFHRHPERKRRISVRGDGDSMAGKYQSAGRRQTAFRLPLSAYRCPRKDVRLSDDRRQMYCIPEGKRVQAPYGARVLSFVRFAPNDGFRPGTAPPFGLVQRGVIKYHCVGEVRRLRRQYKCCLRQQPPLVAGATTFPPQAVGQ